MLSLRRRSKERTSFFRVLRSRRSMAVEAWDFSRASRRERSTPLS